MADLIILDDVFPLQHSGFRLAEYRAYLQHFKRAAVHSTGEGVSIMGDERKLEEVIGEFESVHPNLANRIIRFARNRHLKAKVLYFVFLAQYRKFAETIESAKTPFIFTLYPGGGFRLFDRPTNNLLRECFSHPLFRKVVVTQPITQEYLIENKFVSQDQAVLIPGLVVPDEFLLQSGDDKFYFGQQKSTIDIAFIAHKYTHKGAEKGYCTFVEAAHRLHKHKSKPRFHVIGGFDCRDIDVSNLNDHITFHGSLGTAELIEILRRIDLVISPNAPGLSGTGLFDGFPTGSAVQAGLMGAALFCTDELMQNRCFVDKEDLVLIPANAKQIADSVSPYLEDMDALYKVALTGRETFKVHYGRAAQLEPRIKLLEELLETAG